MMLPISYRAARTMSYHSLPNARIFRSVVDGVRIYERHTKSEAAEEEEEDRVMAQQHLWYRRKRISYNIMCDDDDDGHSVINVISLKKKLALHYIAKGSYGV